MCRGLPTTPRHPHHRARRQRLKLSENPLMRALAVVVAVAVGIRLTFELLEPVWPYLLAVLVGFALVRVAVCWRDRW